jgi:PucR family transcriptional regulator, purine catabolism regulatory protein
MRRALLTLGDHSGHLAHYDGVSGADGRKGLMSLWLEHLLEDPGLGLALVAGHAGLPARGPVRWAHISEIPDPTPWLEGGELLLTTGLGIKDSPELQRRLMAGLDARGCAGVGFGLGVCLDEVPPTMVEEANARDLPLFTVPYEVPFIAVTKRVSRHIFDEHYATLRGAVELHRQVLGTVLAGSGVQGVLDTVGRPMPDFDCLLFDYYGQVLAHRPAARADALDLEDLWRVVGPQRRQRDRFELPWGDRVVIGAVVRLGEQTEALFVLVSDRSLHEHEQLLVEQGLTGVSLELARGLSVREARRMRVDELLDEVADSGVGARTTARHLLRLGVDAAAGYRVLCLCRPDRVSERSLCALVEDAVAGAVPPVVGRHGGLVYAIVHPPDVGHADRIADAVAARGWRGVVVGRSRPKQDAEGLASGMREAAVAASSPGDRNGVRDVTALGLPGLLAGIDDSLGADAFVTQILGPVLDYDAREGAQLVDSLRAYLHHGCRPGPAAAELCVHRHTLTYRLDRIGELTGRDPRDGEQLLAFGLALELHARTRGTG